MIAIQWKIENKLILAFGLPAQHSFHGQFQGRFTKLEDDVVTCYVQTEAAEQQDGYYFFQFSGYQGKLIKSYLCSHGKISD